MDYQNGIFYFKRGVTNFNEKEYRQSLELFSKSIEIFRNENSEADLSSALAYRALIYLNLNDYQKGINDCLESLKINPNAVDTWITLSKLYFFLGYCHLAIENITIAYELEPQNIDVLKWRAYLYFSLSDYKMAKEILSKLVKTNNDDWSMNLTQKIENIEQTNKDDFDDLKSLLGHEVHISTYFQDIIKEPIQFGAHNQAVDEICLSNDGTIVATRESNKIHIWAINSYDKIFLAEIVSGISSNLSFSPDGSKLYFVDKNFQLNTVDIPSKSILLPIPLESTWKNHNILDKGVDFLFLDISHDGAFALVSARDFSYSMMNCLILRIDLVNKINEIIVINNNFSRAFFLGDSTNIGAVGSEKFLVIDLNNQSVINEFEGHDSSTFFAYDKTNKLVYLVYSHEAMSNFVDDQREFYPSRMKIDKVNLVDKEQSNILDISSNKEFCISENPVCGTLGVFFPIKFNHVKERLQFSHSICAILSIQEKGPWAHIFSCPISAVNITSDKAMRFLFFSIKNIIYYLEL